MGLPATLCTDLKYTGEYIGITKGSHGGYLTTSQLAIKLSSYIIDPQGDSQMHSSSSEDNDYDTMFPNEQQQGQLHSSELSPPHSQDPIASSQIDIANDDVMDTVLLEVQGSSGPADQLSIGSLLSNENTQRSEPGWAWKNKKAREEHARALEQVVDKAFSLSECSDNADNAH